MLKTCSQCQLTKPLGEFSLNRRNKDGRQSACKVCVNSKSGRYYLTEEQKAAKREYMRQRRALDPAGERARTRASRNKHIEKRRAADRARHDPEKYKRYRLERTYGITLEEVTQMLSDQGGCGICRRPEPTSKGWQVDHDHDTGKVRGILCAPCNMGIGQLYESPDILLAALAYLKDASTEGASAA